MTPIERLQKSAMSVDKLRAEMASPAWENTLADFKAGDDVAMLKIEAAQDLYNKGAGCWDPTQKKVVFAAAEKERAEKWARRVAIERIRKYAPVITVRAESAPINNIEKRASATEKKTMSKRMNADFTNVLKGEAPDVQDFEFRPDGLAKVPTPATGKLDSPKPTDATRPAQYPADSFLHSDESARIGGEEVPGDLQGPVTTPYVMHTPGTVTPDASLFADPSAPDQTGDRAMYSPSTPAPLRLGNAYQLNAGTAVPVFKREGMFTDLLLGEEKK